jgi:hypothetical protein
MLPDTFTSSEITDAVVEMKVQSTTISNNKVWSMTVYGPASSNSNVALECKGKLLRKDTVLQNSILFVTVRPRKGRNFFPRYWLLCDRRVQIRVQMAHG